MISPFSIRAETRDEIFPLTDAMHVTLSEYYSRANGSDARCWMRAARVHPRKWMLVRTAFFLFVILDNLDRFS